MPSFVTSFVLFLFYFVLLQKILFHFFGLLLQNYVLLQKHYAIFCGKNVHTTKAQYHLLLFSFTKMCLITIFCYFYQPQKKKKKGFTTKTPYHLLLLLQNFVDVINSITLVNTHEPRTQMDTATRHDKIQ